MWCRRMIFNIRWPCICHWLNSVLYLFNHLQHMETDIFFPLFLNFLPQQLNFFGIENVFDPLWVFYYVFGFDSNLMHLPPKRNQFIVMNMPCMDFVDTSPARDRATFCSRNNTSSGYQQLNRRFQLKCSSNYFFIHNYLTWIEILNIKKVTLVISTSLR